MFITNIYCVRYFFYSLPFKTGDSLLYISTVISVDISPFTMVNGTLNIKSACHSLPTDGRSLLYASMISFIGVNFSYAGYTINRFDGKLMIPIITEPTIAPMMAPFLVLFFFYISPAVPVNTAPRIKFESSPTVKLCVTVQ